MRSHLAIVATALALTACTGHSLQSRPAADPALPEIDIAYQKHILPNGLTLIVHEDRKAPIVAVNVWYHVGSKDEPPGRSGFAHLFEHLMFQGSEHHRDDYFIPFERVGATEMNGTTSFDRTNYFQNVPRTALDLALWMESDRMGHLLGAVDQALLDQERGVVQNEKRQHENQPYGRVWEHLQLASFPEGHPYRRSTIGSMDDLDAATLEHVHDWFRTYYGAANATLVVAGDVDGDAVYDTVLRHFGDIGPGPPLARQDTWIAARTESTRSRMHDRVAQTRVYRSWNIPPFGDADEPLLELAAQMLGGGRSSRLYQRLVVKDQLADNVSAYAASFEIAGLFGVQVDVRQGVTPAAVETAVTDELRRFIERGPDAGELGRAKTGLFSSFVRGAERIGGFGGKADVLAQCAVYTGSPGCYRERLRRVRAATAASVQDAARRWLAQGEHALTVHPYPDYAAVAGGVDRTQGLPEVSEFPDLAFPELQRATLSNGLPVVLAQRHDVPQVHVQLLFDAGHAADTGAKGGTASFTLSMLSEGTRRLTALQLAEATEALGMRLTTGSGLDHSQVSMSALTPQLPDALALFAEAVREPGFREQDMERLRARWLAGIAQEKTRPVSLALRTLPPLLYGDGHAYAVPLTGTGTEASVSALTAEDLQRFHAEWLRPDGATLIVVGDTTLDDIRPLLEQAFGDWAPPPVPRPHKNIGPVPMPKGPSVYLMDRPGAAQSVIIAGLLAPPSTAPNHLEIETMNSVFGGEFSARLNRNLREDKQWSYGAYSFTRGALGPRPFMMYAPVQTDRTAEAMLEMLREARDMVGTRPAGADEVAHMIARRVRSLPGEYETAGAVLSAVAGIVLFGRPEDYVQSLKSRMEAQTPEQVHAAALEVIRPQRLTWLVVGDLSQIEAPVRALDLGEIRVLDADGVPMR